MATGSSAHDQNIWELSHVLFAKVDDTTGAVTVHVGDVVAGESYDDAAAVYQQWGWISLPSIPTAGQSAAEAIALKTSGPDVVFAGRDVRSATIAGLLKPGESCAYASTGTACTLYKRDGSVTNLTTDDNTDTGHSVFARVATDGFLWACPWGKMTFDSTGFHVLHASGARIDIGGVSGMPAPLDTLGSYFTIGAKMGRIEAAILSVGTTAGTPEPVAKATTLYALLSSIAGSLSSISTTLAAVAAGAQPAASPATTVGTALSTELVNLATTISATTSAITAALTTLPSSSTTVT